MIEGWGMFTPTPRAMKFTQLEKTLLAQGVYTMILFKIFIPWDSEISFQMLLAMWLASTILGTATYIIGYRFFSK